jgi:hypothetical protein
MDFPNPPGYYQIKDAAYWPFKSPDFSVRDRRPETEGTWLPRKDEVHTFAGVQYQWDSDIGVLDLVSAPTPAPTPVPPQSDSVPDELTINGFKYRKVL